MNLLSFSMKKLELNNWHAKTKVFKLTLLLGEEIFFFFPKFPFFLSKLFSNGFRSNWDKNELKFYFAPNARSGIVVIFFNSITNLSALKSLFKHSNCLVWMFELPCLSAQTPSSAQMCSSLWFLALLGFFLDSIIC